MMAVSATPAQLFSKFIQSGYLGAPTGMQGSDDENHYVSYPFAVYICMGIYVFNSSHVGCM